MDLRLRRTFAVASILLLTTLGLVACSDDTTGTDGTEDPDTSMPTDTGGDTTAPDGGPVDALPDEGTDSSGDDVTEDTEPADSGDRDMGRQDMGISPDGGGEDAVSRGSGPSSHISQVTFRESESNDNPQGCCRDFDGDNNDDSALGDLIQSLYEQDYISYSLSDISMSSNGHISAGNLVFLIEYGPAWSSPMSDSGFYVYTHTGVTKPTPWDTDGDNVPEFKIDPVSLNANGQPESQFSSVSVNQGRLTAQGGTLFFSLLFGSTGITADITLHQARLSADVDSTNTNLGNDGQVALTNGEISGIVNDDDLFTTINKIQKNNCSCLNGQDMFTNGGSGQYSCTNYCSNSPNDQCTFLACGAAPGIIYSGNADADADGQGGNDDFTFGMEFEAEGADITGVGSP